MEGPDALGGAFPRNVEMKTMRARIQRFQAIYALAKNAGQPQQICLWDAFRSLFRLY
jgi:hypothetical protein